MSEPLAASLASTFTDAAARKMEQYLHRIGVCIAQLDDDAIWFRSCENENAPGNLMLHLSGNVTQWILSGVGGAPDERRRNEEFDARDGLSRDQLLARLTNVVTEAVAIIRAQTADQLMQRRSIQGYSVTVLEAIFHVAEHFSQHTGQIIFATKKATQKDLGFYRHLNAGGHRETTP
ncbi:MAG: DUF1572 family protein [Acidobacteria bacterium]|nr:DUF1572 family protein [Acidobacteriota bacterium]